jgi:nitroimidazol reductase NimA-like FMN-containing flavoprotein (pyridoxamine 5'-phosphate oxidase superfamily)
MTDFDDLARSVLDENRYMVLGTADDSGHPWVSPVWFASENYREFHWVSGPETRHSQNIESRRRSRSWSSTPPVCLARHRPST